MIKMILKVMNAKWKKKSVLLGSSVTMTDCIMEWNEQLTFLFSPKNIIRSFLNLILMILLFKEPQATPRFVDKEYMGYEHTHGWGSLYSRELHRKEILFQYQKMVLDPWSKLFSKKLRFCLSEVANFSGNLALWQFLIPEKQEL